MKQTSTSLTYLKINILTLMVLLAFPSESTAQQPGAGNVLHVMKGASGDGSSWTSALGEVRDALSWAKANESSFTSNPLKIWVAAGTYTPTDDGDREKSFVLVNNVALYGGFYGTETSIEDRDWNANETILSGDLNADDLPNFVNNEENSYHVIWGKNVDATAVLDGFFIIRGNADGANPHNFGGGIYNNNSSATLANLQIRENYAQSYGGGISTQNNSDIIVSNSLITGNSSNGGGGMVWSGSFVTLVNVGIIKNKGAGVFNANTFGKEPMLINTIILGNQLDGISGIQDELSTESSNNLIQVGQESSGGNATGIGTAEANTTPMEIFTDFDNGDFSLKAGAYAIDAGNNALYNQYGDVNSDVDLAGNARLAGTAIDMGPYEYTFLSTPVLMTSFEVTKKNDNALLMWSTATEDNNKGFYVEHGRDAQHWAEIGFIASKAFQGNSKLAIDYNYTHPTPGNGTHLYRLKQVDRDGKSSYSEIKTISFDNLTRFTIYPNPVASKVTIKGLGKSRYLLKLHNSKGQLIGRQKVHSQDQATMDMSRLPTGIYYLEIADNTGVVEVKKVVKE